VAPDAVQQLHHFVAVSPWPVEPLEAVLAAEADELLDGPDAERRQRAGVREDLGHRPKCEPLARIFGSNVATRPAGTSSVITAALVHSLQAERTSSQGDCI
jgi:hypothetical protein